ncbi:MAG: hypothetical protein CFE28_05000 [Alphaproteobacteria bacterium PA2]|nr:MAG: hypothetical protein CFE28_05000 [Alphaproteobacteria bacterium PA2]
MWNCTIGGLFWLTLPFLIGLVTGWWVWAQKPKAPEINASTPVPESHSAAPQAFASAPPSAPAQTPKAVEVAPVAAAPLVESPQPKAPRLTAIGIPAAVGAADDLLQIKGIGPKLNAVLNDIGVVRFDQIAAWGEAEIARVDDHLGAFRGRIDRDAWVDQASLLAKGLIGEFEARFGKLDTETK